MPTLAPIALTLALQPLPLRPDAWQDVRLELVLENRGAGPVDLYPGVALPWLTSGWGSPAVELETGGPAGLPAPRWIELRTRHGPPGLPPVAAYFEAKRAVLAPGERLHHALSACWLPRRTLRPEQLEPTTLDPDGMDGLVERLGGAPLADASVLVLGTTCADLRPRAADRELLRGVRAGFFFAPATYRVRATYAQEPWVQFHPSARVRATSGWVELAIAG